MTIKEIKTNDLKPYKNNPRNNDTAVEAVANSIREFGFKVPIVIDKNNVIVAGHTRWKAANMLGLEKVPCIVADDLTDEQVKAFRLADNKTAELAEWDFEKLETELAQLADDFEMTEFGFEEFENEPIEVIEDEVPEVDEENEPIVERGQIWKLGNHRLMCGSSTEAKDIEKLMGKAKAKILFTSPPYSDMREYEGGKDLSVESLSTFIKKYEPFAEYQCVNLGIQRKNQEIVQYWDEYIAQAKNAGYKLMSWNVWDKTMAGSIGQEKAFFPIYHEWIFVFGREFYEINKTVEKKETSIREGNRQRKVRQADGSTKYTSVGDTSGKYKQMGTVLSLVSETGSIRSDHPAVFPVGLPSAYIQAMTNDGENVIEPFCGSGTTLIACEELGRNCFAMELEPKYCDVIIKRWETLTGEKAELIEGIE